MRKSKLSCGPTGNFAGLLAALALLIFAFGANAADGCWELYSKSGATPGTPSCRLDVASNTPSGMGSYGCRNDFALIDAWCSTTETPPDDTCPVADPVFASSGAVTLAENDFISGDELPVTVTRTYRSTVFLKSASAVGPMWFHNWQRQLNVAGAAGSSGNVIAYRANGEPLTFTLTNGTWRTKSFSGLTLTQHGTGWVLTDLTTENTETYSSQGVLLSEATKTGFVRTLSYDGSGRLAAITQHGPDARAIYDLTLRFEYDDKGRIARLVDPAGHFTQYRYDANSNLASVTWPDGNVRQYAYGDSRFTGALTGVIDETGSRIATWTYDAQGRATAVSHPDTTKNVQFAYGSGTTTVTDSNGARTLSFSAIGGRIRPIGSSGSLSGGMTWDASGSLLTTTAPGRNAAYGYDETGRPVKATVRTSSAVSVTSVQYADATSLHPAFIAMPGKLMSFVYDNNGNVTGYGERITNDLTGEAGFDATWDGRQQRTIGARYDQFNRLAEAITYVNNIKAADWVYFYDETGNLNIAQNIVSKWLFSNQNRDAAHRVTWQTGNYRTASIAYDARGRVSQFKYNEKPTNTNGWLGRLLNVDYGYSPNGRVVSRNGTVATNGGAAVAISSEDTDRWLDNYEAGIDPVGPPANLLGWVRSLASDVAQNTSAVCVDCGFIQARLAWPLFLHDLYFNVQTGKPIDDDPVEIQVAAQNQLPFPVLTPNLSQRSALYAKVFPSAIAQTSGFVKCKDDSDCRAVRTTCRKKCSLSALPTGDFGVKFWNCVNDCAELSGCPRI
jgi:YD repeat-containing protein